MRMDVLVITELMPSVLCENSNRNSLGWYMQFNISIFLQGLCENFMSKQEGCLEPVVGFKIHYSLTRFLRSHKSTFLFYLLFHKSLKNFIDKKKLTYTINIHVEYVTNTRSQRVFFILFVGFLKCPFLKFYSQTKRFS